tara:strand:+ start:185 stop:445 length:261 start_codon:yes stop_codon:yes gene_type:complete
LTILKRRADRSARAITATADAHRDTHVGVVADAFIRHAAPAQSRAWRSAVATGRPPALLWWPCTKSSQPESMRLGGFSILLPGAAG